MTWRHTLCLVLAATAAAPSRAQYQNSPHVVGDHAEVSVVYDQRVNNHSTVQKKVIVYRGPRADEVRAELEQVVQAQTNVLSDLLHNDLVPQALSHIDARLNEAFASDAAILDALASSRAQLDRVAIDVKQIKDDTEIILEHVVDDDPRRVFLGVTGGYTSVFASDHSNGGFVRLDAYLFTAGSSEVRHMFGLGAGGELIERSEVTVAPDGSELESAARGATHLWGQLGYELWLLPYLTLRAALAAGAQRFDNGRGDGWYPTFGALVGPELRLGSSDRVGLRLGAEWAPHSMTSPTFDFDGLRPDAEPERSFQHVLRFYLGFYYGLGRARGFGQRQGELARVRASTRAMSL